MGPYKTDSSLTGGDRKAGGVISWVAVALRCVEHATFDVIG